MGGLRRLKGLLLALPAVFLMSCSSVGGVQVPGERSRVYKNVLSEYFLVADAYLENKKYDKAIEFYTKALGVEITKSVCADLLSHYPYLPVSF